MFWYTYCIAIGFCLVCSQVVHLRSTHKCRLFHPPIPWDDELNQALGQPGVFAQKIPLNHLVRDVQFVQLFGLFLLFPSSFAFRWIAVLLFLGRRLLQNATCKTVLSSPATANGGVKFSGQNVSLKFFTLYLSSCFMIIIIHYRLKYQDIFPLFLQQAVL